MIPLEKTSYLTQVRMLRALASDVVKKYPIKVKTVEFIKYSANAIFKITDTHHKKYMLRIHPADFHAKNAILEEFKWLNIILNSTDILVPKPLYSNDGNYLVEYKHPEISKLRYCAMFEWLEGRFLWKGINEKYAYNVGSLIAQLQASGSKIKIKHRNYWNTEGLIGTEMPRLCNIEQLTGVSQKHQEIITAARCCVFRKLKEYENTHPEKLGLIHEDLNPNNIILQKDNYGVIDFDDCGVGIYGYDLTTLLFSFEYLTENEKKKSFIALKEALYQGYAKHVLLTQADINMVPYFMLVQKLKAIAALEIRKENPKMRPWFQKAIERAITFFKLNKWNN